MSALEYIRAIATTGSVCPSSPALAQAVEEAARRESPEGGVVFMGIGNGVIAKRFLDRGDSVFLDIDQGFCNRFEDACQGGAGENKVVCADAADYLKGGATGRLVVSCLPVHGPYFSEGVAEALANEVRVGGKVLFYSYAPTVRWSRISRRLKGGSARIRRAGMVLINFPPAFVYVAERAGGPA